MSDVPSVKDSSREKISEFARLMDLEFDRTEFAVSAKKIWTTMREEYDKFGKCHYCRKESGQDHTFEECVSRIHGRIDQLYRPRES